MRHRDSLLGLKSQMRFDSTHFHKTDREKLKIVSIS
jgi:hypothetical protein